MFLFYSFFKNCLGQIAENMIFTTSKQNKLLTIPDEDSTHIFMVELDTIVSFDHSDLCKLPMRNQFYMQSLSNRHDEVDRSFNIKFA